jgi:hypothetical protein
VRPSTPLVVPPQTPLAHASFTVHASPSSHAPERGEPHAPVSGTQTSSVHGLPSSGHGIVGPVHAPAMHVSSVVHGLRSSHGASSGLQIAVRSSVMRSMTTGALRPRATHRSYAFWPGAAGRGVAQELGVLARRRLVVQRHLDARRLEGSVYVVSSQYCPSA